MSCLFYLALQLPSLPYGLVLVYSLMNLLDKSYDRRCEDKTEINLSKAENQIAALSQYTEFLKQKKYEKTKEHFDEVEALESDMEKMWELFH